ncbi:MAG: hypothetical protein AAF191_00240, partial [Verrucomicrobiota bacterium]
GSTGFSAEDAIDPATLLVFPPVAGGNWNAALPGPDRPPELRAITVTPPAPPDGWIDEVGKEIGAKSPSEATGGGVGQTLGNVGKGLAAGAILGLASLGAALGRGSGRQSSEGGKQSGPGEEGSLSQEQSDHFLEWAQRHWEGLFDARKREIDRLLEKLKEDPDEGLRYALPLAGGGGGRGTAPPSTRLGLRQLRFDASGGGSGPSDHWDLEYEQRLALEKQYRDAALREIKKGNHDRAAYIYGNLLGDWLRAAEAFLEAGRYRDAVSLYLHKLRDSRGAARCYEKGGLWAQAADLYEKVAEWEKAGDLHHQLGDEERARELWIKASDHERDVLKKAALWSKKLKHDAVALELLDREWPKGNRSRELVREMLRLLQGHDHVAGGIKVGSRVLDHSEPIQGFPLVSRLEVLHESATCWRSSSFSEWVEEEMWTRIADEVSSESKESGKFLALVPQIVPMDRLLDRDVRRFSLPRKRWKGPSHRAPTGELRLLEVIKIPVAGTWTSLRSLGRTVTMMGRGEERALVGRWEAGTCRASEIQLGVDPGRGAPVTHELVGPVNRSQTILHFPSASRIYFQTNGLPRETKHESFASLENVLAVGPVFPESDFIILQRTPTHTLTVSRFSKVGDLMQSIPVDVAPPHVEAMTWHLARVGERMHFATNGFFASRARTGVFAHIALHGIPHQLAVAPNQEDEVLLVVESDVLLIVLGTNERMETINLHSVTSDEEPPVATFLHDGSIAIAWRGGGCVYASGKYRTPSATFGWPSSALQIPTGIVPCGNDGLMVLMRSGELMRYALG